MTKNVIYVMYYASCQFLPANCTQPLHCVVNVYTITYSINDVIIEITVFYLLIDRCWVLLRTLIPELSVDLQTYCQYNLQHLKGVKMKETWNFLHLLNSLVFVQKNLYSGCFFSLQSHLFEKRKICI